MEAKDTQVRELLKSCKKMIIPNYQREFVWSVEDAKEFFKDLVDLDIEKTFFLGTFIFNQENLDSDLEIVDGQQRITTILLLLIAIRSMVKDRNETEKVQSIQDRITLPSNPVDESRSCRLKTSGRIGKALEGISHLDWNGEYNKETMGGKRAYNKLKKAHDFFYSELKDNFDSIEELVELFKKIENITYVEIIVKDKIEAISTFEKVNARGQHLAVYDLLKSFLFYQKLEGNSDIEDVEKDWEKIKQYAEDTDSKLKKMLNSFYFSKKGYTVPSKLYKKLKDIAEPNIKKFVYELKSFSKFYSIILSNDSNFRLGIENYLLNDLSLKDSKIDQDERITKISKAFYNIGLFKVNSVYPLIYSSLKSLSENIEKMDKESRESGKMIDEWIKLIEFFEIFIFNSVFISQKTSKIAGQLESLYSKYCQEFSKDSCDLNKSIKKCIDDFKNIPIKTTEQDFIDSISDLSYENKNDCKIILYIFDKLNRLNSSYSNSFDILPAGKYKNATNTIEHILSQSDEDAKDESLDTHSIGNLIILYKVDNSRLGNKKPSEKVKDLKKWLENGTIETKRHVKEFIDFYEEECKKDKKWDAELIHKRNKHLAKIMYKNFNYKN